MTARGDSLGQRIRQAYVDAGLNRSQFQRALGVAYSTVLMWERDRTQPNADNLRLISEDVSIYRVIGARAPKRAGARAHDRNVGGDDRYDERLGNAMSMWS